MTASDPKERILAAAERIFTEQGLDAVSLRAVTMEAGVNIAAVNYYFGSKAVLLQEMTKRSFLAVNEQQLQLLDTLEQREGLPTVEELLAAYTTPIFQMLDSPRGREWIQALMMSRSSQSDAPPHPVMDGEGGGEVTRRYFEAFCHVLPHLTADELWWRFERTHNLLMANQGKHFSPSAQAYARGRTAQDERDWLITFLTGGLQMPATTTQKSRA